MLEMPVTRIAAGTVISSDVSSELSTPPAANPLFSRVL